MKLLGGVSESSKEPGPLWFSTEKNSARAHLRDKWFIRISHLWGLEAGGRGGVAPQELTKIQFYNQRKSGDGEITTFFLILD